MYVIRRNEDGKYVRPGGYETSYTDRLQEAKQYPTRESAERDKCGNETVVNVRDILPR